MAKKIEVEEFLEKEAKKLLQARHDNADSSEDDRYLLGAVISSIIKDTNIDDENYFKIKPCNIKSIFRRVLDEKLLVDGVSYCIIRRGDKIDLHENLQNTLSKLSSEQNINIFVSVFSKSQAEFLRKEGLIVPESPSKMPLSTEYSHATDIFDCQLVVVRVLKDGKEVNREVFTKDLLLSTARIVIKDKKVCVVSKFKGVERLSTASIPWSSGSDSLEMLKKTAIRKVLKNLYKRS